MVVTLIAGLYGNVSAVCCVYCANYCVDRIEFLITRPCTLSLSVISAILAATAAAAVCFDSEAARSSALVCQLVQSAHC